MWNKTFKIGTFFNIPLKMHWSFILMLGYVAYVAYLEHLDIFGILWFVIFMVCLFLSVILHEFGHALMARHFDIKTKDIIISPIGGVARLNKIPKQPHKEFLIAIMGPMVNLLIALILFLLLAIQEGDLYSKFTQTEFFVDFQALLPAVLSLNIILFLFNLLPAFPMDGGRILRSLLALKLPHLQATQWASYTGQFFGVIFVAIGIYTSELILPFIGMFVLFTAVHELKSVKRVDHIEKQKAIDIARTYTPLQLSDNTDQLFEAFYNRQEKNFIVFHEDKVVGAVTEYSIFQALHFRPGTRQVAHLCSEHFEIVDASTPLEDLVELFNRNVCIIAVHDQEAKIVKVVDRSDLENYLRKI